MKKKVKIVKIKENFDPIVQLCINRKTIGELMN